MKSSIYDYDDYKSWLISRLERGSRKALSDAIGCQMSHLSAVTNDDAHLSLEQAEGVARFLSLNNDETEFLLLLVQKNRAGTPSLKRVLDRQLNVFREKRKNLKERLAMSDQLATDQESLYYSSWQFGAVHVALSLPETNTPEIIGARLGISIGRVRDILDFLCLNGLAEIRGDKYHIGRSQVHLSKSSPFVARHHINWRLRAIASLEGAIGSESRDTVSTSELHYSSVVTLSKKDFDRVHETVAAALSEALKIITSSPEEDAAILSIDWMRL